jgi:hypothetical protein
MSIYVCEVSLLNNKHFNLNNIMIKNFRISVLYFKKSYIQTNKKLRTTHPQSTFLIFRFVIYIASLIKVSLFRTHYQTTVRTFCAALRRNKQRDVHLHHTRIVSPDAIMKSAHTTSNTLPKHFHETCFKMFLPI